jgi:hypothetical protein
MVKFWTEPLDPERHNDLMAGFVPDGGAATDEPAGSRSVYIVRECGFTFQFQSLSQLDEALRYFNAKVHPSSRVPNDGLEHWFHRWFERLPAGLTASSKRERIVKALQRARASFASQDAT